MRVSLGNEVRGNGIVVSGHLSCYQGQNIITGYLIFIFSHQ